MVRWPQWCNQDPVKRLRWSSLIGFWIGFFCPLYNHLAVNINPVDTGFIDASETFEIKTNTENEYYKLTIKVPGRLCLRISSVAWIVFFTWTARIVFLSIRRDMKGRHDWSHHRIANRFSFFTHLQLNQRWNASFFIEWNFHCQKKVTVLLKILPKVLLWYSMIWIYLILRASWYIFYFEKGIIHEYVRKFCKKLTFLTSWYAHVRVRISGSEMLVFRNILPTYSMNDPKGYILQWFSESYFVLR